MPTVSAPRVLRRIRSRGFAIEAALLRASVDALSAGRFSCRHCHRSPLVGERVHIYESTSPRHDAEVVCELCRPLRAAPPDRTELVRSAGVGSVTALAQRP